MGFGIFAVTFFFNLLGQKSQISTFLCPSQGALFRNGHSLLQDKKIDTAVVFFGRRSDDFCGQNFHRSGLPHIVNVLHDLYSKSGFLT